MASICRQPGSARSNAAQRNQRTIQESVCYTGREAGRVAGGGTDEIPVGDYFEGGEADRRDECAEGARAGRVG